MELSVREWMIIIGALLIVAVLLDGYRRIRNENRHRIKVSLARHAYRHARTSDPVIEERTASGPNPELPNGGARVIGTAKGGAPSLQLDQPVPVLLESVEIPPQPFEALAADDGSIDVAPSAVSAQLASARIEPSFDAQSRDVDDSYGTDESHGTHESHDAPVFSEEDDRRDEIGFSAQSEHSVSQAAALRDEDETADDGDTFAVERDSEPQHHDDAADIDPFGTEPFGTESFDTEPLDAEPFGTEEPRDELSFEVGAMESPTPAAEVTAAAATRGDTAARPSLHETRVGSWDEDETVDEDETEESRSPWPSFGFFRRDAQSSAPLRPGFGDSLSSGGASQHGGAQHNASQEVLAIYVVARDGEPFKGQDLLQLLLACDLRFGKMNIFHRHEKPGGRGAVQFSVANIAEPGTFDLDRMEEVTTPGVCLFLVLPGPEAPYKAFDYMVETAQVLVKHLDGELRDDAHSALTRQTLEHCRQRIRDFERKQLTLHL